MKSKSIPKNSLIFNFSHFNFNEKKFYGNMLYQNAELKIKPIVSMAIIAISLIFMHTYTNTRIHSYLLHQVM